MEERFTVEEGRYIIEEEDTPRKLRMTESVSLACALLTCAVTIVFYLTQNTIPPAQPPAEQVFHRRQEPIIIDVGPPPIIDNTIWVQRQGDNVWMVQCPGVCMPGACAPQVRGGAR